MAKKKKTTQKSTKITAPKIKYRYRTKYLPLPEHLKCVELHRKKLLIKRAVPIMPCSLISHDHKGRLFAHTQAEEVYQVYREKCDEYGLVIRRIDGESKPATYPRFKFVDEVLTIIEEPCVRYNGTWEICDVESGGRETFKGSGDGTNDVWSVMSAQTIAKKAALLDYFETAWPAPTDFTQVVRETIEKLGPDEMCNAIKQILPSKIVESTSICDIIMEYFANFSVDKKKAK